jgi:hypothetical protein
MERPWKEVTLTTPLTNSSLSGCAATPQVSPLQCACMMGQLIVLIVLGFSFWFLASCFINSVSISRISHPLVPTNTFPSLIVTDCTAGLFDDRNNGLVVAVAAAVVVASSPVAFPGQNVEKH